MARLKLLFCLMRSGSWEADGHKWQGLCLWLGLVGIGRKGVWGSKGLGATGVSGMCNCALGPARS